MSKNILGTKAHLYKCTEKSVEFEEPLVFQWGWSRGSNVNLGWSQAEEYLKSQTNVVFYSGSNRKLLRTSEQKRDMIRAMPWVKKDGGDTLGWLSLDTLLVQGLPPPAFNSSQYMQ